MAPKPPKNGVFELKGSGFGGHGFGRNAFWIQIEQGEVKTQTVDFVVFGVLGINQNPPHFAIRIHHKIISAHLPFGGQGGWRGNPIGGGFPPHLGNAHQVIRVVKQAHQVGVTGFLGQVAVNIQPDRPGAHGL